MSVEQFIHEAYRVSKAQSNNRHERLLTTKKMFMEEYGAEGLERYFDGSNKKLYLEIEALTQPYK